MLACLTCVKVEPEAETQKLAHSTAAKICQKSNACGASSPQAFGRGGGRLHRPMPWAPMHDAPVLVGLDTLTMWLHCL